MLASLWMCSACALLQRDAIVALAQKTKVAHFGMKPW
jgi:hypothetical protein